MFIHLLAVVVRRRLVCLENSEIEACEFVGVLWRKFDSLEADLVL